MGFANDRGNFSCIWPPWQAAERTVSPLRRPGRAPAYGAYSAKRPCTIQSRAYPISIPSISHIEISHLDSGSGRTSIESSSALYSCAKLGSGTVVSPAPLGNVRFGEFEAKLGSGELCRRGGRVRLPDQSFQILAMLLERPGQLVTREE